MSLTAAIHGHVHAVEDQMREQITQSVKIMPDGAVKSACVTALSSFDQLAAIWTLARFVAPIVAAEVNQEAVHVERDCSATHNADGDKKQDVPYVQYPEGGVPGDTKADPQPFVFVYRNHRGEVAERHVIPKSYRFGSTEWHPKLGHLMFAYDLDKKADREFAMADIVGQVPRLTTIDADQTMLEVWADFHKFYTGHLRGEGISLSMADQQAFYEIAQPALRRLVSDKPPEPVSELFGQDGTMKNHRRGYP